MRDLFVSQITLVQLENHKAYKIELFKKLLYLIGGIPMHLKVLNRIRIENSCNVWYVFGVDNIASIFALLCKGKIF